MSFAEPFDTEGPDAATGAAVVLAEVTVEAHPTLEGRVRVAWHDREGGAHAAWVGKLRGLVLRARDRVLVSFPANGAEPVVTGVVDGVRAAPDPRRSEGPNLALKEDERLQIAGPDGTPWLEIEAHADGPRLRVLVPAAGVDVPGTLRLAGDDVELHARTGEVRLRARGDVRVEGETVQLN